MFRKYAAIGLAIALLLTGSPGTGASSARAASKQRLNRERAVASYEALQRSFYQADNKLYLEQYPRQANDNPHSYVWPLREATAATIDMAGLPEIGGRYRGDVQERLQGLQHYWNGLKTPPGYDSYTPPPLGQGGDIYYDDNDVIGLELVRVYQMTGDQAVLDRAERVFELVSYGWDDDPSHPCPGGEFWTQGTWYKPIRATNATALGAELALHLYELTGRRSYLDRGRQMYEWNRRCVLAPNGLYWNDMDLDGQINKTLWIYNHGAMIGAGALLYHITGDVAYLHQAERTADAALEYYGDGGRYYIQPPIFDAIFFKNLLLLDSVHHDHRYRQAMQEYADRIWAGIRDPETGLFKFDAYRPVHLLEQSAMVQIYAALSWDPQSYRHVA